MNKSFPRFIFNYGIPVIIFIYNFIFIVFFVKVFSIDKPKFVFFILLFVHMMIMSISPNCLVNLSFSFLFLSMFHISFFFFPFFRIKNFMF